MGKGSKFFLIQTGLAAALAILVYLFYVLPLWSDNYMKQIMK